MGERFAEAAKRLDIHFDSSIESKLSDKKQFGEKGRELGKFTMRVMYKGEPLFLVTIDFLHRDGRLDFMLVPGISVEELYQAY